jgi:hypothetical protein
MFQTVKAVVRKYCPRMRTLRNAVHSLTVTDLVKITNGNQRISFLDSRSSSMRKRDSGWVEEFFPSYGSLFENRNITHRLILDLSRMRQLWVSEQWKLRRRNKEKHSVVLDCDSMTGIIERPSRLTDLMCQELGLQLLTTCICEYWRNIPSGLNHRPRTLS